ncbi:MAG: rod shape-determining protein MreD [Clostridia bacterium]|nr:rod shape-determining protein MreD [Clostridia bacterium]
MLIEKSRLNLIGAYGLFGLGLFLLQTTLLSRLQLFGAAPVLTVAVTVCVALFEGELTGALFGFLLGFAIDVTVAAQTGVTALTLMLVGTATGLLCRMQLLRNMISASVLYLLAYGGVILGNGLFRLLVTGSFGGYPAFVLYQLTTAVVSCPMLPLCYYAAWKLNHTFGGIESDREP